MISTQNCSEDDSFLNNSTGLIADQNDFTSYLVMDNQIKFFRVYFQHGILVYTHLLIPSSIVR